MKAKSGISGRYAAKYIAEPQNNFSFSGKRMHGKGVITMTNSEKMKNSRVWMSSKNGLKERRMEIGRQLRQYFRSLELIMESREAIMDKALMYYHQKREREEEEYGYGNERK